MDCRNRLGALLIAADQVAHIVARIGELPILHAGFHPLLHGIGERDVNHCHGNFSVSQGVSGEKDS